MADWVVCRSGFPAAFKKGDGRVRVHEHFRRRNDVALKHQVFPTSFDDAIEHADPAIVSGDIDLVGLAQFFNMLPNFSSAAMTVLRRAVLAAMAASPGFG